MKQRLLFSLFALSLVRLAATPVGPENVVYKPTFLSGYTSLTAGTGYIAKLDDTYVFLTAYHLFGPAAGLEHDLAPAEAKEFVGALAACSMNDRTTVVVSSEMLLIPSAKAFGQNDATHDVAAFRLPAYHGPALVIAKDPPKAGDKIYLFGRPRGEEKLRLLSAVVHRATPGALEYFYEEAGVNFAGTSGAPILNEAGELVGMNLGGGETDGREFGFGNPAASMVRLVSAALHQGK